MNICQNNILQCALENQSKYFSEVIDHGNEITAKQLLHIGAEFFLNSESLES